MTMSTPGAVPSGPATALPVEVYACKLQGIADQVASRGHVTERSGHDAVKRMLLASRQCQMIVPVRPFYTVPARSINMRRL